MASLKVCQWSLDKNVGGDILTRQGDTIRSMTIVPPIAADHDDDAPRTIPIAAVDLGSFTEVSGSIIRRLAADNEMNRLFDIFTMDRNAQDALLLLLSKEADLLPFAYWDECILPPEEVARRSSTEIRGLK